MGIYLLKYDGILALSLTHITSQWLSLGILPFSLLTFKLVYILLTMTTLSKRGVTHLMLFQFKSDVSPDVIKDVCAIISPDVNAKPNIHKTCDRILELQDNCIHPKTQTRYVKNILGGRDNAIEGFQVWTPSMPADTVPYLDSG